MKQLDHIFDKYKSLKVEVKAALWFTICNLLQKGIAMITMPLFTRLLTTEQYGVFTVYQSWYAVVSIIVTFNLAGGVVNNGMVKYENKRSEFISSMQGLTTVLTTAFFIAYLAFYTFWNRVFGLSTLFMLTMFFQLLFEPAYLFWSQRQRYEYRYKTLVAVTLGVSLLSPAAAIVAILSTEYKAEARVIAFALVQVCVGLVFMIIQYYRGRRFFVKDYWRFALGFTLPLIPHYLSQIVLGQSDRIMIARMVGNSEAAIYGVAYNIATVITLFINAVNASFIPFLYENTKNKNYEPIKKTADFLCLFMAAVTGVFMLFGPEAIRLLAAPEYESAKWIMPPVTASVFFVYIYTLFINVEFYFEKTKYVMFVSVIGAGLNILLNYIFIPKYGFIAAAYTTVFCYIIFALSHYLLQKFILKQNNIESSLFDSKRILIYSAFVLVSVAVSLVLYNYNVVRYAFIAVLAVIAIIKHKALIEVFRKIFMKEKTE